MSEKDLELVGKEKEEIVKEIRDRVSLWGLTLPDVPAILYHLGLNDFYNVGDSEFDIMNNLEEGYCGKFIFLFKDQTCPMHYHVIKHETFYIVKGEVEMEAEGQTKIMKQGDIKVVSQNQKHRFTGITDMLLLESSKPDVMNDSIFEDDRINKIANSLG